LVFDQQKRPGSLRPERRPSRRPDAVARARRKRFMWCPCLGEAVRQWSAWLAAQVAQRKTLTRRQPLKPPTAALPAPPPPPPPAPHRAAADSLLAGNVSVDLHSHPGLHQRIAPMTLQTHLDRIARGHLKVALLAAVGDGPVIRSSPTGRISQVREPVAGELYAS